MLKIFQNLFVFCFVLFFASSLLTQIGNIIFHTFLRLHGHTGEAFSCCLHDLWCCCICWQLTKEIESKIMESEASPELAPITFEIYTSCRAMVKLSQYVTSQE